MTTPLYRDFHTREELDREYDIEATVPDFMSYVHSYIAKSAAVRDEYASVLDVRYGATVDETYDVFLPDASHTGPRPCLYFIHGGYWKVTTSKEWSCIARGLCDLGFVVAIENYSLRPTAEVSEIVRQHRAGYWHFYTNLGDYGGDPARVVVGGHSVGGHAVASLLQTEWAAEYGIPNIPYAGALAISGLYDLRPLPHTFLGPELGLDQNSAERLSPELHPPARSPRLVLAFGSQEPGEFARQTEDFAQTLLARSGISSEVMAVEANHFDILDRLEDPNGDFAQVVVRLAG